MATAFRINPARKNWYILIGFALITWLAVNQIYATVNFNWLLRTDAGWYYSISRDLSAFDSAVTVGFPLIWRVFQELMPMLPPALLGQLISLLAHLVLAIVIYEILVQLNIQFPLPATILILLFPLVGLNSNIMPRTNATYQLIVFSAILAYLRQKTWLFIICVALTPLFHRSSLPLVGVLTVLAIWSKRIRIWALLPMALPLLTYWLLGIEKHNSLIWYMQGYRVVEKVTGLPLGDGLVGTILLGVRGSAVDLVQAIVLNFYWLLACYLIFIARIWRTQPFLLAITLHPVILGLILPVNEIWAMFHYSTFFSIAIIYYLQIRGLWPFSRLIMWGGGIILFISQVIWALYVIQYSRA